MHAVFQSAKVVNVSEVGHILDIVFQSRRSSDPTFVPRPTTAKCHEYVNRFKTVTEKAAIVAIYE